MVAKVTKAFPPLPALSHSLPKIGTIPSSWDDEVACVGESRCLKGEVRTGLNDDREEGEGEGEGER